MLTESTGISSAARQEHRAAALKSFLRWCAAKFAQSGHLVEPGSVVTTVRESADQHTHLGRCHLP